MMNGKTYIKRQVRALLVVVVLLVTFFGFTVVVQVMQQYRIDAVTRREAVEHMASIQRKSPPSSASQRHWRRAWTCPVGVSLTDVPAAWSNGWIAATEEGGVVSLDNSGRVRWTHAFSNASFVGSPVVAGTNTIVVGRDGRVTALHVATGELLWQVVVDGAYRHGPLVLRCGDRGQVVLLSASDGVLHALDLQDGHERWRSEPTNRTDGSPGFDEQILAYGNCDSAVHIFSITNGAHLAQIPVGADEQMAGGVLVREGRVYGGTRSGALVCVDAESNNIVWHAKVSDGEAFNTPVTVRDLVIMGSRDGRIAAFAARDGVTRWQVSLSNAVKSLCVVDDAVFAMAGGSLVGLRATDGGMFMKLAVGDDVDGPVWNGRILAVAADGGNIIGFRRFP